MDSFESKASMICQLMNSTIIHAKLMQFIHIRLGIYALCYNKSYNLYNDKEDFIKLLWFLMFIK